MHCTYIGRITAAESIFRYGPGESTLTYRNASFTPLFEIPSDDAIAEEARNLCTAAGTLDKKCIYDYYLTGDADFAKATMDTQKVNKETVELLCKNWN